MTAKLGAVLVSAYLICLTGTPRSVRYRGVTYFANISAKTMLALKRIWGHICVLSPICLELPGQWTPPTVGPYNYNKLSCINVKPVY